MAFDAQGQGVVASLTGTTAFQGRTLGLSLNPNAKPMWLRFIGDNPSREGAKAA
ncbi:hypothetical protein D187_000434 [Cystobacter fuscus DSM 2262]|uniref:Uncharacterized protein n=1 Tax=Cystobacter fuscus (strain ATCC 25194 / DSM 2262 / NBRC 100088 / M29) TaxID=1242864 RepID=S9QUL2_CYSF2|nr:hypothetical protein D187_000434 [Cystobacter fuscus DSM 2262]